MDTTAGSTNFDSTISGKRRIARTGPERRRSRNRLRLAGAGLHLAIFGTSAPPAAWPKLGLVGPVHSTLREILLFGHPWPRRWPKRESVPFIGGAE
jgi:hypothetical protein